MFDLKHFLKKLFNKNNNTTNIDIDAFIDILDSSNIELSSIEIADILWLSKYLNSNIKHYKPIETQKIEETKEDESSFKKKTPKVVEQPPQKPKIEEPNTTTTSNFKANLNLSSTDSTEQNQIEIPRDNYFQNSQSVVRYLTHFRKKIYSKRRFIFDEDKTVDYIAHTKVTIPFFQPKKEKLYTLYLFIDHSQNMEIWQELIGEYEKLLRNSIVFKDIVTIYMDGDNKNTKFYKDKRYKNSFTHKSLTNYREEKIIFILSDMMSISWREGDSLDIFNSLYKTIPLFIIQMLPYRKWRNTVLKQASITTLSSKNPYPTSKNYQSDIDELLKSLNQKDTHNMKIPLVNLDLEYLRVIGDSLKSKDNNKIDGAVIDLKNFKIESLAKDNKSLSTPEKLEKFFANSSLEARELIKNFSAVPLNMAIMKMIQSSTIKDLSTIYLAEVLNSNLIEKNGDFYEFKDDIRDYLLKLLGREKALEIIYNNSDYIEQNLNTKFSFKALLSGKVNLEEIEFDENDKLFAFISCKILESLGKEYADKVGCKKKLTTTPIKKSKRFLMGSNDYDDEKPIHKVTINYDFEIAQYPVTVGEFKAFAEDGEGYLTEAERGDGAYVWDGKEYKKKKDASWKNPYFEQTDEHPVVCVSWHDAQDYIKWLNKQTGENYRLPTEVEWEYSARAGTTTKWSFGDDEALLGEYAWYNANSNNQTHEVGELKANPWGLHDMHGNVWEWCQDDWVDSYEKTPRDGKAYRDTSSGRKVLRGGSWNNDDRTRSSDRDGNDPTDSNNNVGFRLLRTLP